MVPQNLAKQTFLVTSVQQLLLIFSEENLIKKHLSFLIFWKIRASTGVVGGDGIPDFFFLNTYSTINGSYAEARWIGN